MTYEDTTQTKIEEMDVIEEIEEMDVIKERRTEEL